MYELQRYYAVCQVLCVDWIQVLKSIPPWYPFTPIIYFWRSDIVIKCNVLYAFVFPWAGATNATGFAAIKLTALGRPQLLVSLNIWRLQLDLCTDWCDCEWLNILITPPCSRTRQHATWFTSRLTLSFFRRIF